MHFNDFYVNTSKSAQCCLGVMHVYKKHKFVINLPKAEDTSDLPRILVTAEVWMFSRNLTAAADNLG
jgi:hypothetical protein